MDFRLVAFRTSSGHEMAFERCPPAVNISSPLTTGPMPSIMNQEERTPIEIQEVVYLFAETVLQLPLGFLDTLHDMDIGFRASKHLQDVPEVVDVLFGASVVVGEIEGKPDYPVILPSPLVDCRL